MRTHPPIGSLLERTRGKDWSEKAHPAQHRKGLREAKWQPCEERECHFPCKEDGADATPKGGLDPAAPRQTETVERKYRLCIVSFGVGCGVDTGKRIGQEEKYKRNKEERKE